MAKSNPGGRKGETNAQTTTRTGMTRAAREQQAAREAKAAKPVAHWLRGGKGK